MRHNFCWRILQLFVEKDITLNPEQCVCDLSGVALTSFSVPITFSDSICWSLFLNLCDVHDNSSQHVGRNSIFRPQNAKLKDTFWNARYSLQLLCTNLLVQVKLNNSVDFNYWKISAEQTDFQFAAMYNSVTLGHVPRG